MLSPPFDNHITQYNTEISSKVTKLNIFVAPENEQGKIEIVGNEDLKEGNNSITIIVTAPNGITKREYYVNVYKRNADEEEKYRQQQEENKKKLEEAYNVEKTSVTEEDERNIVIEIIGLISIITVITILIVAIYYKKKFSKEK